MKKWLIALTLVFIMAFPAQAQSPDSPAGEPPPGYAGPVICKGWLYWQLHDYVDLLLSGAAAYGKSIKDYNSSPPEQTAWATLSRVQGVLSYVNYFNNLTPAFSSLLVLMVAFLIIMSMKIAISLVKWLKQILPGIG